MCRFQRQLGGIETSGLVGDGSYTLPVVVFGNYGGAGHAARVELCRSSFRDSIVPR